MGLSEQNDLHWGAMRWYYEIMAEQGPGVPEGFPDAIRRVWDPQAIVRHVRRCLVCRKHIDRLKEAVTEAGGETNAGRSGLLRGDRNDMMKRDVIDTLSLHFRCLEEQVTCWRVKPFLPGLLIPSVQIRIPTPITVHIDHCGECADDLNALRELDLNDEQLERLERLYQQKSEDSSWLCRRARSKLAAFVRGRLGEIDGKILSHLCTCPRCRQRVHDNRQKLLESTPDMGPSHRDKGVCSEIPMTWLFDYAVPYGRTEDVARSPGRGRPGLVSAEGVPPSDRGQDAHDAQGQDALATLASGGPAPQDHVRACRSCLQRIQELDETIYGIAERTDSGIATVYRTTEPDAQPQYDAPTRSDAVRRGGLEAGGTGEIAKWVADSYPDYPIHVQVMRGRPQPVAVKAAAKRPAFDPRVRFLLKTAVAAAAMIPLTLIFLHTSTASGITLAQMYRAFGEAPNVHVSNFDPSTGRLIRQFWISREKNVALTAAGQGRTLYDLGARTKRVYPTPQASPEIVALTEREYMNRQQFIDTCLGFALRNIPRDAKWTRLREKAAEGVEVYELAYTEQNRDGRITFRRKQILLDPATRLPREAQAFRRLPTADQWQHLSTTQFQYLTQEEMTAVFAMPLVDTENSIY